MLNQEQALDRMFFALADPSRREIVERLVRGPASVSQLAEPFAMSLPAVLQHLTVLERAGLIASEKVGRVRTCRIESTALRNAEDWIGDQRLAWERRLDRLGDVLGGAAASADKDAAPPGAGPTRPAPTTGKDRDHD